MTISITNIMKKILQLFLCLFIFTSVFSATVPPQTDPVPGFKFQGNLLDKPQKNVSTNESNFIKRLQQKVIEKRLKRYLSKIEKGNSNTETLSTLSLIFGAIAAVTIFTPIGLVAVILGPAALILGIIALSRDNASKSAKTKALLGVIFGGVAVAILLLALAFIAAWSW